MSSVSPPIDTPPPPYQECDNTQLPEYSSTSRLASHGTVKHVVLRILVGVILAGLGAYLAYVCVTQGLSRLHHIPAFGGFLIYMGSAFGVVSLGQLAWTTWKLCDSDEFSVKQAAGQTAALIATPVVAVAIPIVIAVGISCCPVWTSVVLR